jgi:hypothetical protein
MKVDYARRDPFPFGMVVVFHITDMGQVTSKPVKLLCYEGNYIRRDTMKQKSYLTQHKVQINTQTSHMQPF